MTSFGLRPWPTPKSELNRRLASILSDSDCIPQAFLRRQSLPLPPAGHLRITLRNVSGPKGYDIPAVRVDMLSMTYRSRVRSRTVRRGVLTNSSWLNGYTGQQYIGIAMLTPKRLRGRNSSRSAVSEKSDG